jgi:sensor histidine kinase YesM
MLDLIISKYATLCESKNIKFDVDVKTANLNYIDDVDLSTLMNNLLDNAVEATEQSKERYIKLNIFSKNNLYDGLIIKNSCDISPINKNNNLETTKSNSKIHGIGISSIKKVIKKYNAVYDWKYDENKKVFETDIAFLKTE